jgi:hypothetical protein
MLLTEQDAAEAIREVEQTQARSARLRWYEHSSPYFILWGILWAVAYGLCDVYPQSGWIIWLIANIVGLSGSAWFDRRGGRNAWRGTAVAATLIAFFNAAFAILPPASDRAAPAFITLVVATVSTLLGIWRGPRLIAAGVGLAALTLGGFFFLPAHFLLWMAFVGGGMMVSIGLWLRTL